MDECNDGRCQTNHDGVKHFVSVDTCYEKLYNVGKCNERIFVALSLSFLIIGASMSAIMIAADEHNNLKSDHCVSDAIYNNSTEKEYLDCISMKIYTINYKLFSLILLILSTILAYHGKFRYYRTPPM